MANVRKSYKIYDTTPNFISATGDHAVPPYTALGTTSGLQVERQRDPNMKFLTAYVAGDGVGLSFAPDATSVSEHVFRYYLGNTGGTASPKSGSLLHGYGLLDISQSNEYLDIVGSLSRGTGTGSDFSTAVTYVNGVLDRLHSDFPNMKWSVRGVPFNHYFLIPSPATASDESPFGTGNYFHPQHGTGDVNRVYDWRNASTDLAQFYRDRSKAAISAISSMKWICPEGTLHFDNTYPFFKSVFDPDTMYHANKECFNAAKSFTTENSRVLGIYPVSSPLYLARKHEAFDPSGGLGTGSSANATPSSVSIEMMRYQVLQPMKDTGCDGLILWNNINCMLYSASISGSTTELTSLSRNFFGNGLYGGNLTDIDWTDSIIKGQNALMAGTVLSEAYTDIRYSTQLKAGESCCPPDADPCVDTPCKCTDDGSDRPWCFEIGQDFCCTLGEKCAWLGVVCDDCSCGGGGSDTVCQYSPGSPGDKSCPPDFVSTPSNPNCGGFPCPACANPECCCAANNNQPPLKVFQGTYTPAANINFRSLYMLPYGGAFGSGQISVTKNSYFLVPSVVQAIDPLALTGQANYLSTTGSIE